MKIGIDIDGVLTNFLYHSADVMTIEENNRNIVLNWLKKK